MAKEGERYTEDEIKEYAAYHNAQLTPPAKFDDMVQESTDTRGVVYRHATADEKKTADDAAAAGLKASEEQAALDQKIRQDAAKAATAVAPPPAAPAKPS